MSNSPGSIPRRASCLDGHALEEAAAKLACGVGALRGHLQRGARLHQRLAKRGISLAAALAIAGLSSATSRPPFRFRR